jgi:NADH dehydrogenase/NADH:ubiquinone oxidoreductase subunit G
MPTLTMDGKTVKAREGAFILEAAREAGIAIPALCNHEALEPYGGCRLCMVDVTRPEWDGWCKMVAACLFPVEDGLIVHTRSERVMETRRVVLDLLLARCPATPLIQKLAREHGIEKTSYQENPSPTDCILCGLCTRVCDHLGVSAIAAVNRGIGREIAPPFMEPPPACIGCLSCAYVCPTGFIKLTATDLGRAIWNKEFEMLRCRSCGRGTITLAQAVHHNNRFDVPNSYFDLCDSCKRRQTAATFASLKAVV